MPISKRQVEQVIAPLNGNVNKLQSTGVISGLGATINGGDNTKFDIQIVGQIVDPITFVKYSINVNLTSQTVTNLLTTKSTWIAINQVGLVIQQSTPFTNIQKYSLIGEWELSHYNQTNIEYINSYPNYIYSLEEQLHSFMNNIDGFNISGNIFSANGVNLKIDKTLGYIHKLGVGNQSITSINEKSIPSQIQANFTIINQSGDETSIISDVDTSNYDLNGITTALPGGPTDEYWQTYRIYLYGDNLIKLLRGQYVYTSMSQAQSSINTEFYVIEPGIEANGILRGYLIVRKGTTDLSDNTKALFIEADKFGLGPIYGMIPTLQNSYNSGSSVIKPNDIRGSLIIQNGRSSNSSNIQEWKNIAGTTTAYIQGDGSLYANPAPTRANLFIDKLTNVGNTNYNILATDKTISLNVILTTPRIWTLPLANSVNPGYEIIIQDEIGGISSINTLTINTSGGDTINGVSSITLNIPYSIEKLISNGNDKWTFSDKQDALLGTGFVVSTAGVISYDTNVYLTGNQNIILSGDITGSGTTSITTTIGANKVLNSMLAGSIDNSKLLNSTISGVALGSNLFTLTIGTGLTGTSYNGSSAVTINIDSTVVTLTGSQALSNKTGLISQWTNDSNYITLASALTGLSVSGGTITNANTVLSAFGALQNQINNLLGGVTFISTYNATTNTPTLIDGTGTKGHYYVVNVAGNQDFGSGSIDFNIGDWVIYNGTIWQKVDNTDAVTSVNGAIGSVVITTTGTANRITVTGGSGLTPTIDISASYVGQSSITTLGTITTGVWNGTAIANANLANSSITIGSTNIALGATSTTLVGLTSVTSTSFIGALTGNASTVTNGVYTNTNNILTGTNTFNNDIGGAKWSIFDATGRIVLDNTAISSNGSGALTAVSFIGALTGNASTATSLQTSRNINGVAFNGTADITVTSAASTLTGTTLNATVVNSSLTSVGIISSGTWNGTSISTTYTDAKIISVTGTANAIVITGTATDPIFNIGSNVVTLTGSQALSNKTGLISQWTNDTGYLTGNQTITLTGNVTGSGTISISTTIGSNVVTLAMMAQISTATFLGRTTAGTGNVEALTIAQTKTLLDLSGTNSGDVTLAGQNYLSIVGQVITANAVDLSTTHVTGILAAARFPALTGDVTTTSGSLTTSILDTVVTGKLLTGYVSTPGVITASDSILTAIQKLNGNVGEYSIKSTAYTLVAIDGTIEVTVSGSTQTLPTAIGILNKRYRIINTSNGIVRVNTTLSQTIGNNSISNPTFIDLYSEEVLEVISNNSNWRII